MNALLAYVNQSDFRVSHRLVGWRSPRWFRVWMITATRLGDGWLWLLLGPLAVTAGGRGRQILGAAAAAAVVGNGLLVALKRRVRRSRPCALDANPHLGRRYRPQFSGDSFSFPSGHSLNAFAVGTVVALAVPGLLPAAFVVAASVAASRVFLGLHFLTDVVAGAALGTAVGLFAFEALVR